MRSVIGQAARFGAVGVLNTVFGLAAIWIAMLGGVAPLPANAVGFALGLMVSFVLNRAWTFRLPSEAAQARSLSATAPRFLGAFIIAWPLNVATVWAAIAFTPISPYIAQIAGVMVYSVAFFVLCRVWVFQGGDGGDRDA